VIPGGGTELQLLVGRVVSIHNSTFFRPNILLVMYINREYLYYHSVFTFSILLSKLPKYQVLLFRKDFMLDDNAQL
jgi:hypothetical protein